jgi:plasmid stabilization system protein ParE
VGYDSENDFIELQIIPPGNMLDCASFSLLFTAGEGCNKKLDAITAPLKNGEITLRLPRHIVKAPGIDVTLKGYFEEDGEASSQRVHLEVRDKINGVIAFPPGTNESQIGEAIARLSAQAHTHANKALLDELEILTVAEAAQILG